MKTIRYLLVVVLLIWLPVLSIAGTTLVNNHQGNTILILLLALISLAPLLIVISRSPEERLLPIALYFVSLALLLHRSLISSYLGGWDIQFEYASAIQVAKDHYWYPATQTASNSMLSVAVLAPEIGLVTGIDLVWVFKAIYPALFALVPVCIYSLLRHQVGSKVAFLSSFFFVAFFVFYAEMVQLAKQEIGELALVLLLLVLLEKRMLGISKAILVVLLGLFVIVSHYSIAYFLMILLPFVWIILKRGEVIGFRASQLKPGVPNNLVARPIRKVDRTYSGTKSGIDSLFIFLFFVLLLFWNIFTSGSYNFNSIVRIGDSIVSNLFTEFLNPQATQSLDIVLARTTSPLHQITKYLHLGTQILIVYGIAMLVLKKTKCQFAREYDAFSYANLGVVLGALIIPYFASAFNTSRLYHISLIFLAPFCIVGGLQFISTIAHTLGIRRLGNKRTALMLMSGFLGIFLLFNSGFIYEVANDNPTSISLDTGLDGPYYNDMEVFGAEWLSQHGGIRPMYTDSFRYQLFSSLDAPYSIISGNISIMEPNSNLFLGTYNIDHSSMYVVQKEKAILTGRYIDISNITNQSNMVYDIGGSLVLNNP